ncbi:MAG: acetyl-CoA carboxylase [Hyphomicrobiaceae bacterium]|nr:acetyl-CoA carboxylase [Hyphomicrobiaceae bacterium]
MGKTVIEANVPGVFYRRPSPDEPPYKSEGDTVEQGDIVGLIEVMKNYIELRSEVSGTVIKYLVEHEDPVNPGQAIVEIET